MKKILIVEDEPSYSTLLQEQLKSRDYDVILAKDGKQGLKVALAEHPDLILLDIRMPVMDGTSMLTALRKEGEFGAKVKVIMLTNLEPDVSIIKKVLADQPTYYLIKSDIKLTELFEKIDKLIQ